MRQNVSMAHLIPISIEIPLGQTLSDHSDLTYEFPEEIDSDDFLSHFCGMY